MKRWAYYGLLTIILTVSFPGTLQSLTIQKQNDDVVNYNVDVADTPYERKRGLMYVESIAKNEGKLLVFDKEDTVSIWMKNTFIPLDIVFIDKNGCVTEIVERPDTLSEATTSGKKPSKYVLEINLGEAKKQGIGVGDKILLSQ